MPSFAFVELAELAELGIHKSHALAHAPRRVRASGVRDERAATTVAQKVTPTHQLPAFLAATVWLSKKYVLPQSPQ